MEQLIGQRIGGTTNNRYQIESLLGKQSGRRTFLAQDCQTQQRVVVKLVLFSPDFDWQDLKLFEREAETLQSLDHPAIPKYLDSFEVEMAWGRGFALVQTYIEAKTLQAWVSAGRTFSENELRAIAQSLLQILNYLHHRNPPVIHRDIKPSNILLQAPKHKAPTLYLVDFGSVKTAQTSGTMTIVGTYGYMPPEQFGGRAQPASDLYSLGATLIYLATGKHPADLTQNNLQISFEAHSNLSPAITKWIKQLIRTDISQRTATATAALQQLSRPQPKAPVGQTPPHSFSITRTPSAEPLKPTFRDFKVFVTPEVLEIRCPQSCVSENFVLTEPINFSEKSFSIKNMVLMAIVLCLTLLFVTMLSTEPLILAVLLLAMIFAILFPIVSAAILRNKREARLKLSRSPEGKTLISLSTVPSISTQAINIDLPDHTVHFVDLPLLSLFLGSDSSSVTRITLFLAHSDGSGGNRLQIAGTYRELQWLKSHISQWDGDLASR